MSRIEFFCTDRGQHRKVDIGHSLGRVVVFPRRAQNAPTQAGRVTKGTRGLRRHHGRTMLSPYVRSLGDGLMGVVGTEFLCPKCGRTPQIREDKLAEAIPALVAAGITEVDISRLPF